MHAIGIDPGITGAVSLVEEHGNAESHDMPTIGNRVDIHALDDLLTKLYCLYGSSAIPAHLWLERAQPMPRQGVTSTYRIGENYGMILGLLATRRWRYTEVRPNIWKRALRLPGKDKEVARARAQQLFPACDLKRKRDHGRAEALLIAWYGLQQMSGMLNHD